MCAGEKTKEDIYNHLKTIYIYDKNIYLKDKQLENVINDNGKTYLN